MKKYGFKRFFLAAMLFTSFLPMFAPRGVPAFYTTYLKDLEEFRIAGCCEYSDIDEKTLASQMVSHLIAEFFANDCSVEFLRLLLEPPAECIKNLPQKEKEFFKTGCKEAARCTFTYLFIELDTPGAGLGKEYLPRTKTSTLAALRRAFDGIINGDLGQISTVLSFLATPQAVAGLAVEQKNYTHAFYEYKNNSGEVFRANLLELAVKILASVIGYGLANCADPAAQVLALKDLVECWIAFAEEPNPSLQNFKRDFFSFLLATIRSANQAEPVIKILAKVLSGNITAAQAASINTNVCLLCTNPILAKCTKIHGEAWLHRKCYHKTFQPGEDSVGVDAETGELYAIPGSGRKPGCMLCRETDPAKCKSLNVLDPHGILAPVQRPGTTRASLPGVPAARCITRSRVGKPRGDRRALFPVATVTATAAEGLPGLAAGRPAHTGAPTGRR